MKTAEKIDQDYWVHSGIVLFEIYEVFFEVDIDIFRTI
jgi:hypothetical protein